MSCSSAHASVKRTIMISSDEKSPSSALVLANVTLHAKIATNAATQPQTAEPRLCP